MEADDWERDEAGREKDGAEGLRGGREEFEAVIERDRGVDEGLIVVEEARARRVALIGAEREGWRAGRRRVEVVVVRGLRGGGMAEDRTEEERALFEGLEARGARRVAEVREAGTGKRGFKGSSTRSESVDTSSRTQFVTAHTC